MHGEQAVTSQQTIFFRIQLFSMGLDYPQSYASDDPAAVTINVSRIGKCLCQSQSLLEMNILYPNERQMPMVFACRVSFKPVVIGSIKVVLPRSY